MQVKAGVTHNGNTKWMLLMNGKDLLAGQLHTYKILKIH